MRFKSLCTITALLVSIVLYCVQARAEEKIVWGKTFHGLQGGISFAGSSGPFKVGDKVTLNMYWRNVTKAPIQIQYVTYIGPGFRPTLWTHRGTRLPMMVDIVTGISQSTRLDAGQTLRIAQPVLEIIKPGTVETDDLLPHFYIGAGHYRVNVSGGEAASLVPPSGMLDLNIIE